MSASMHHRMEILFVSHKYPPAIGGMEKQSFELIEGMRRHATVHAIVYTGGEARLTFFLKLNRRILRMLRKNPRISIIHFNEGLIAACSFLHTGYAHISRTVTLHGLDVIYPNKIYRNKILPAFNRFSLVFAVSKATAAACIGRGIDAHRVVVVPNGVDHSISLPPAMNLLPELESRFNLSLAGKRVLLAMGRPVRRKGISWFIRNVAPLLREDHVLLLIGSLPKRTPWAVKIAQYLPAALQIQAELLFAMHTDAKEIRELVTDTDANKRHLGRLNTEEVVQLLHRADAFVMPNIPTGHDMEGFGLVCLEASLCGAMVFASDIDGIPDAVHPGKNGSLLAAGDKYAWAEALNGFLKQTPESAADRTARMEYTRNAFSWDSMCDAYARSFKDLTAGQKKPDR